MKPLSSYHSPVLSVESSEDASLSPPSHGSTPSLAVDSLGCSHEGVVGEEGYSQQAVNDDLDSLGTSAANVLSPSGVRPPRAEAGVQLARGDHCANSASTLTESDKGEQTDSSSSDLFSSETGGKPMTQWRAGFGKPGFGPHQARGFSCQVKPGSQVNHNQHITEPLSRILEQHSAEGSAWQVRGYQKAIGALKRYPQRIESVDEALRIQFIGPRIGEKIREILETGRLQRAEFIDPRIMSLGIFQDIWGVGITTANDLYSRGCRTLSDVYERQDELLNTNQRIGLKYYYEFKQRIPRAEVKQISDLVRETVLSLYPSFKTKVCGSYRRGLETCGDIDILITDRRGGSVDSALPKIIQALHDRDILTDDLARSQSNKDEHRKYMGVCHLPGTKSIDWNSLVSGSASASVHDSESDEEYAAVQRNKRKAKKQSTAVEDRATQLLPDESLHRRIDIQMIPSQYWPCAMLYFTGSGHFNRSMRLYARHMGYQLNEKVLQPRITDDTFGDPLKVKTERDVFRYLGLAWREPHERDVGFKVAKPAFQIG